MWDVRLGGGPRLAAIAVALGVLAPAAVAVEVPAGLNATVASAEPNGVGLVPAMGWSSWSFLRKGPTEANVEAQARALVSSGLARVGYDYVNLDDFWYICPGPQGPVVDNYGRWEPNSNFPSGPGGQNGIEALAAYVHHLGLKFGLYVTPGISLHAVDENTVVLGPNGKPSGYRADQIAGVSAEYNYNCGGMVNLDTMPGHAPGAPPGTQVLTPGAQDFLDSWADEFASWGIDYLKLDGVGSFDIADVIGWSQALRQTGRPIHLELSNNLAIGDAGTWSQYANGWRTGNDIECYSCEQDGSSYPLTDWANVALRFEQAAAWQPYGRPGAFNDYDSIEVGNGSNDGLTLPERQSQLSLWALASAPLLLGTDLTHLDRVDLRLLTNKAVIAVDQDGIDASRVADSPLSQTFAKRERNGDIVVGLFNTGPRAELLSANVKSFHLPEPGPGAPVPAAGPPGGPTFHLIDLWDGKSSASTGLVQAEVPPHGVALFRVSAR